ncbi:sulfotransferase [Rhodovulum sp. P5]|uniref:sulfotransferase family protein n=1 Tax=Rhodovulum sp. P5 TaxID=1564506 RepID=UPI0009DB5AAF|nr:sulfotransferase [Rhodovulum sp. P5]
MTSVTSRSVAVYGALRSGTTLLRLMLDGHPALSCPGETDFLFDHVVFDGARPGYDAEALENDRIYRDHRDLYPDRPLADLTPDALIDRIAGADQTAVLMLHRHLDRLLEVYPDMRIIHLVRDPRDVARSSIGMGWAGTVYYGVDHWIDTETGWQALCGTLKPEQVIQISYEDLINAPEATLRKLCDFIGIEFVPGMLQYDETSTYSSPDPSLVAQWKRKMTAREVGLVEHKVGGLLAQAGYAPSGYPARAPGRLGRLALRLNNRRLVLSRRIERYGLRDALLVFAASRLGVPSLAQGAQRRIDGKTVRYLK